MRRAGAGLLLLGLLAAAGTAWAAEPYDRPTKGNQFVSNTEKYLYVVWSVPNDLAPFAGLRSRDALEAFIARTAIFLCKEHRAEAKGANKPCTLQLVRMSTNDEYTKSAAAGFKTAAKLVLPLELATQATLDKALGLDLAGLKALFSRFDVKHDRLAPAKAP